MEIGDKIITSNHSSMIDGLHVKRGTIIDIVKKSKITHNNLRENEFKFIVELETPVNNGITDIKIIGLSREQIG